MSQAADRIRPFVQREPRERLATLLHHITVDVLCWAYFELKRNAPAGADGLTSRIYAEGLEGGPADLHGRVHREAYRATPSRRVNDPKPDGGTRPLGVAAIKAKIVQKVVVETVLTPICEAEFLGFSYGFRPGRGAHNALDALSVGFTRRKIRWVGYDIRNFVDSLWSDWLGRFLKHRIGQKRVIRLIIKWLNAGAMEDGEWREGLRGTSQGSVIFSNLVNVSSICRSRRSGATTKSQVTQSSCRTPMISWWFSAQVRRGALSERRERAIRRLQPGPASRHDPAHGVRAVRPE